MERADGAQRKGGRHENDERQGSGYTPRETRTFSSTKITTRTTDRERQQQVGDADRARDAEEAQVIEDGGRDY